MAISSEASTAVATPQAVNVPQLKLSSKTASLKKKTDLAMVNAEDWGKWREYLTARKLSDTIAKASQGESPSLLWCIDTNTAETTASQIATLLKPASKSKRERGAKARIAEEWIHHQPNSFHLTGGANSTGGTNLAIALTYALPSLVNVLDQTTWCELLGQLIRLAEDAAGLEVDGSPLLQQLAAGELPWTLGCVLPEISACKSLAKSGQQAIDEGILALTDGQGLLHGSKIEVARALLACWTRVQLLGKSRNENCLAKDSRLQYEWFVRQNLRLARADGSQMLAAEDNLGRWCKPLFIAALKLTDDSEDKAAALKALPSLGLKAKKKAILPEPAVFSEWSGVAVLRSSWKRNAARLAVAVTPETLSTELNVGKHTIWSGASRLKVSVAERELEFTRGWEDVCWFSDDDCDYLEIEAELTGGITIQRQMFLAREDGFYYQADAIIGDDDEAIQYEHTLPLSAGVNIGRADETRECVLFDKRPIANVYPLALGEWRSDHRDQGELTASNNGLTLTQRRHGKRLYAPLWFDLKGSRLGRPFTWRQLTVGEKLAYVARDQAVGFRVQSGQSNWLVYRSLSAPASRTVLGQNLFSEFLLGRFDQHGDVSAMIEIE